MNEVERRLREHVERTLDHSAISGADRADVAEELYGHLWLRWQEHVRAGEEPEAAAEAAIASFGGPQELGIELTAAFHSRLYATTIGVLLPAVRPPSGKPSGFTRSRVLLFIVAVFQVLGICLAIYGDAPFRGAVMAAAGVLTLAVTVLAYRALDRAQRWARAFVGVVSAVLIADAVVQLFAKPITVQLLGVLALFVLPKVAGESFAAWVRPSRRVTAAMAVLILVAAGLPWLLPPALDALPDPTLATAADVSITVHADCTNADGAFRSGTVTAAIRWSRTDTFPTGWPWQTVSTDVLGLSIASETEASTLSDPQQAVSGWATGLFDPARSGLTSGVPSFVDATTGGNAAASEFRMTGPPYFHAGDDAPAAVEPGTIRAGRTYLATFEPFSMGLGPLDEAGNPIHGADRPVFRFRYEHQQRFGLAAVVRCGETAQAVPVGPDVPMQPYLGWTP